MVEGLVIDSTYGGRKVSSWVEGAPVRSFWLGIKLPTKSPLEIQSYRCTRCGYLENYAKG
jgi:hypothetical protein